MIYLYIACGGALGACLRYMTTQIVTFPFGTMSVNVLGSFLMGLAFVYVDQRIDSRLAAFVMTGLLGGFTTFSAFSLDAYKLWETGRSMLALGYVSLSVAGALVAVVLGIALARGLWA